MPELGTPITLLALTPELLLAAAGCVVLLLGQAASPTVRRAAPWLTLITIIAGVFIVRVAPLPQGDIGGGLIVDSLAQFVRTSALIVGVLITLALWFDPSEDEAGEYFSMLLFTLSGLLLLGSANDLLVLFLALELVSIPTYIMVALSRTSPKALEAGTKYFYLGALSAAILAYGFALLYGVTGTTTLSAGVVPLTAALHEQSGAPTAQLAHGLATVGLALSIAGLLFKIAAVPFHFYIGDVYQGASSPVAGMLGFVPKLAGLVAIFKVLALTEWHVEQGALFWLLWLVAALSMTVGNLLALMQTNVKRMLAYSGIAHSGYMLVGLLAGPLGGAGPLGDGVAAVLYYVVVYGIANLAAFATLALLRVRGEVCESVRDLAGLLRRHPGLALLMALAMFTLMGLPPTPGFWGKLSLFGSALAAGRELAPHYESWMITLVILAVLNSALAAAYYLRVAAAVLLYESDEPAEALPRELPQMSVVICGFLLILFAFLPGVLLSAGRSASVSLRTIPSDTGGIAAQVRPVVDRP